MRNRGDIISHADVQSRRLTHSFKLTRVGVTGVKKPAVINRKGKTNVLFCTIDVFVDLPPTQKGSHLSRNLEVIAEVVEQSVRQPVNGLEELAANICHSLRIKHEYANYAEVVISADYFMERTRPSGRKSLESFKLLARAISREENGLTKMIGVEVIGMTACPCAMETVKEKFRGNVVFCDDLPVISHNQRNVATVMIEVPEECDVEADELIALVESSFSSPTYEILKRSEEAEIVLNAHNNPMFVEDVVRTILARILERFKNLPDDVLVTVRSESEESIHKHNAFAERVTTLEELRR